MDDPKRVVVIGAGGIGSWLVPGIARALEYGAPGSQLIIVDGDTFEAKNLERQQFSTLGNKAQILRKDIAPKFPETMILAYSAWVVPEDEASEDNPDEPGIRKMSPSQLLQEGDHVFAVVDNNAARALLFNAAEAFENIDVYTGGNGDDLSGSVYHFCRREGRNVTANPCVLHPEYANPEDRNPGSLSCQERAKIEGGTQVLAANMGVASQLLARVSYYMLGTPEQAKTMLAMAEVHFDMAQGAAAACDFRIGEKEEAPQLVAAAPVG